MSLKYFYILPSSLLKYFPRTRRAPQGLADWLAWTIPPSLVSTWCLGCRCWSKSHFSLPPIALIGLPFQKARLHPSGLRVGEWNFYNNNSDKQVVKLLSKQFRLFSFLHSVDWSCHTWWQNLVWQSAMFATNKREGNHNSLTDNKTSFIHHSLIMSDCGHKNGLVQPCLNNVK